MSNRFGQAARLRSPAEFTEVQERGRRASGRYLTLLAHPNATGQDRLGIIASRRVGGAVQRNRAKRRIRAIFRQDHKPAGASATLDFVVIARPELIRAPFPAVVADFQAALKKLRGAR